jgi:hypothetical protein
MYRQHQSRFMPLRKGQGGMIALSFQEDKMKTLCRLAFVVLALTALNIHAATLYVSLDSTNPIPPFASWETAATNIQNAVDVSKAGDTVLVTNGVYQVGGKTVSDKDGFVSGSSVSITNSIRLESVNGPLVTTVKGTLLTDEYGFVTNVVRCVYLGTNAVLSGFTLTNGYGWWPSGGGGVFCESSGVVTNCVLTGNSTPARLGGGACGGTLYNCTLTGNSSGMYVYSGGGGASGSTLYNCTLTRNSAGYYGGGVAAGTLYNCVVYYNTAPNGPNYFIGVTEAGCEISTLLQHSCTTPLPTDGVGNITGPPLFMDSEAGDFRLREDSPCIDAGTNLVGFTMTMTNMDSGEVSVFAYSHDATDIVGNTRFIDGNGDGKVAWDIGAYEFNSFKPPRFSVFPKLTADGWQLNVTGAPNKWAHLQRSANLKDWEDIWSGFMGAEGVKQVNDRDTEQKAMFYRVVVP